MEVQKGFFSGDNQSCIPPGHKFVRSEEGVRVLYVFNHKDTNNTQQRKKEEQLFNEGKCESNNCSNLTAEQEAHSKRHLKDIIRKLWHTTRPR